MLVPPQEYAPSLFHSPSTAPLPFQGLDNRIDQELSELHSWCWTLSRRKSLPNKLCHLILSRSLLTPINHRLSFPTCLFHPGNMHLHCSTVHRLLRFPFRASTTCWIRNSQSSVAGAGLPPGEITSPTNSLTWREFLIGLTTCLLNHGLDNLPLQTIFNLVPTR